MTEPLNPFKIAQAQLDQVADLTGLAPDLHELLRTPLYEYRFALPVRMDDSTTKVFHGYRVQYNDARGPFRGGIRFHPLDTMNTCRALAAWMTWKTAVLDLPLGGAYGLVDCNPKELSLGEEERVCRVYIRKFARVMGEGVDVVSPDVYTTPQSMTWMVDEYSALMGRNSLGIAAGKPLGLGGSLGYGDATARGGIVCIREAARQLGLDLRGATAAIQGYGNVGSFAHALSQEMLNVRVVAVGDLRGAILNLDGLDPREVSAHKRDTGSVVGFPNAVSISNAELLELDVSILIPAEFDNVILEGNAGNIKAKIVAELANEPTTPAADLILHENGVYLIPGFLCSGGELVVSYLEQVQNSNNLYWSIDQIHHWLEAKMVQAFHPIHKLASQHNLDNRLAALVTAVDRVSEAMRRRGWV